MHHIIGCCSMSSTLITQLPLDGGHHIWNTTYNNMIPGATQEANAFDL